MLLLSKLFTSIFSFALLLLENWPQIIEYYKLQN
jgi:hypothetical protein